MKFFAREVFQGTHFRKMGICILFLEVVAKENVVTQVIAFSLVS